MARALALLLIAAPIVVLTRAQADDGSTPRERWERMGPAQREVLRRRFAEFLQLPAEERARLEEEGSRLENRRRSSMRGLTERERHVLNELEPDLRRRVVREFFRMRSLEDGRRVRAMLPRGFLAQLRDADPAARAQLFRDFLRERRLRDGRRLLYHLGSELDIPAQERERWPQLSEEEQGEILLGLGREYIRERIEELGPPADLSGEEWARVDELGDADFFEVWRRLSPSPEYLPRPGNRDDVEASREGPSAEEAPEAIRPERRRELELWREVHELAQFDVGDFVAMTELEPDERPDALVELVRERTLERIRELELLAGVELENLSALEGREYLDALQRVMRARFFAP